MSDFCLILCTCPGHHSAEQLAQHLITEQLAACVNCIDGVRSYYQWQGQLEQSQEIQLFIKTRQALYAQVQQAILALHPYECPEIVSLPIEQGSHDYLQWLGESCR